MRKKSKPEPTDFAAVVDRLRERHAEIGNPDWAGPEDQSSAVLERVGVPVRAVECLSSSRFETTSAIDTVRAWADQPRKWCMVLVGVPGVGKSVAAASWLVDWARGMTPHPSLTQRWYSAPQIRALQFTDAQLRGLESQRMLVVDDLGVEYGDKTGVWQSRLDAILDARYRDYRKTILTTNLGPKALATRYGERVADRLREDTVWFQVPGRSRRR